VIRDVVFWAMVVITGTGCTATPDIEVDVVSSGGFAAPYETLAPMFVASTGIRLNTAFGASMGGAPDSIPVRLAEGETPDVVILSRPGLDRLVADGYVLGESAVDLAESTIGMAIPAGHPVPDISTVEAFTATLLAADSIAYSASVSGTYLSTEVFPRLEVADVLAAKSTRVVSERVGAVVARGDAAIGFQQVSELLLIEGVHYVGELPAALQRVTVFSAAVTRHAQHPDAAAALIAYLASSAAESTIRDAGLRPLAARGESPAAVDRH
jgi:molybdate transport system substrate-binding protein